MAPNLPSPDRIHDRAILNGVGLLIDMYGPFNEIFMRIFNRIDKNADVKWATDLQRHLSRELGGEYASIQRLIVGVTQHWLRTLVWQLCLEIQLLSSRSDDITMNYRYPIAISESLLRITQDTPQYLLDTQDIVLVSPAPKVRGL